MTDRSIRARVALVLVMLLFAPASAWAQDESMNNAKQHFDDGQNFYLQAKYKEAAEKFIKAFEAKPYPAFLFNIAVCYEKDRDYVKAVEYYEKFLKADPMSSDRKTVTARIATIRKHLSPGTTKPVGEPTMPKVDPKGLVVIESTPEGAAIYLDNKKRGIFTRTPYTGSLPPGRHTIILELKEYRVERKTIIVRNDRLTYLYFGLTEEKNLGWIEVRANIPQADVYVDTKSIGAVGRTPYSGNQRPGKRKIIVERPGYEPFEKVVDIIAGKTLVVDAKLERVNYGWLKITGSTTKGAAVKIAGRAVQCGYPCETKLAPGSYKVEISRDGHKRYVTQVEIGRSEEVQLRVRLNPKPSRIKAYVSFGVAAAMLAGGITAGVMSSKRASSLQADLDARKVYDSGDPRFTEGKVTAIVANSLFGLSALVTGLGLYYMFRNEGPDSFGETETKKISIIPILGPHVAGVSTQLRF